MRGAGLLDAIRDPEERAAVETKLVDATEQPCDHTVRLTGADGRSQRVRVDIQEVEGGLITVLLLDLNRLAADSRTVAIRRAITNGDPSGHHQPRPQRHGAHAVRHTPAHRGATPRGSGAAPGDRPWAGGAG